MRIADRIANKILEAIEEKTHKIFRHKDYLDIECMTADIIIKETNNWLKWDTDLETIKDVGVK